MFTGYKVISVREVLPTTHAPLRVFTEYYEEYILKHSGVSTPEYRTACEFLCSALLTSWGLKTPTAAILMLNPDTVDFNYVGMHKKQFFYRPCFGSKVLSSVTEFSGIHSGNRNFFKKLVSPLDFFKLALFDLWVENDDRKPSNTNLLLHATATGYDFVAIDHAFTFSTRRFTELNPGDGVSMSENDSLLYTEFAKKLASYLRKQHPNWLDNLKDAFYLCIEESKKHFQFILNAIPLELGLTESDAVSLGNFLFSADRNQAVWIDFCRRLKP